MKLNRRQYAEKKQISNLSEQMSPETLSPEVGASQPDQNVLKRAMGNPRSMSPETMLQLQQTIGNRAVNRLLNDKKTSAKSHSSTQSVARRAKGQNTVQRKGANVPQVSAMTSQASASLVFKDEYDAVLDEVDNYYNTSLVPNDDYGQQLLKLEDIGTKISAWEKVEGPTTKPVSSGLFGLSSTDKRRQVLKSLQTQVGVEKQFVQQEGKDKATIAHTADRTKLQEYVDDGVKSEEKLLKNSCEWIKVGKTKLYAVTPTGDAYGRLVKGGKNPAKDEAWFPSGLPGAAGDLQDAAATYNQASLTDNTNVNLDDDGKITGGWNTAGVIAITNPSKKTKEKVWDTLRHEVQHDSDKNKGRDSLTGVRASSEAYDLAPTSGKGAALEKVRADLALQSYKTEYRAYSYQEGDTVGPYAALDNTVQDKVKDGFMFSTRQLAIFNHIYKGYAHTKDNWNSNPTLSDGKTFRQSVQSYWNPDKEGFNKYNSARVDDFYLALDAIGTKAAKTTLETNSNIDAAPVSTKVSDENDTKVKDLMAVIDKLHGDDADYIMSEGEAMQKKIKAHLDGKALQIVEDKLHDLAQDSKMGSISLFD